MEGKREVERSPKSRQEGEEEQRGRLHQPRGEEGGRVQSESLSLRTSSLGLIGRGDTNKRAAPLPPCELKTKLKQETTGCGWGHTEGFMD